VIAHRGASGERPENTLSAYRLAVEQRADMIELDLHRSRDGVVVIHHDALLDRLGAEGEIADHTSETLRALDAAPDSPEVERMPILEEVLETFAGEVELNLEIKLGQGGSYEGLEEQVVEAVRARGLMSRILFSCFFDPVLARLRALAPTARIGVLVSPRFPQGATERAATVSAESIHPHIDLVDRDLVRNAHARGLRVMPYTADDPGELVRLLDCGVDGIFTNHPARLRRIVDERLADSS